MVTYRLASTIEEWISALRLVYQSYLQAGLISPNRYMLRVTPYHLLPSTDVFIACEGPRVLLTMTLVRDGVLGIPAEAVYREEIAAVRQERRVFGEVACLAAAELGNAAALNHFIGLVRFVTQYARFTEHLDDVFIVVHPRHALFYEKVLGFQQVGSLKQYSSAPNRPAVLLRLDINTLEERHPRGYQILFGTRFAAEELWPTRLPPEHRRILEPFVDKRFVPMPLSGEADTEATCATFTGSVSF